MFVNLGSICQLYFTVIRPGTQAAEGLSKVDLDKRMKVENVKRQKLKNENIFISPYRLCVRNLPPAVDDKQLKKIFLKSAGDQSAVVTEVIEPFPPEYLSLGHPTMP